jgi:hypothetical protein
VITTSNEEALLRIRHDSSTFPRHQVVRPRWLGDGQRQRFFAEREPSSNLLSFLSGDAWRTPVISGGDTQGPDCLVVFCSRMIVRIWKPLYSNCWFLRMRLARVFLQNCTCHFLMKNLPGPSTPILPCSQKRKENSSNLLTMYCKN